MKKTTFLLAVILVTAIACKKSTTTPGGPGGTTQSTTISNGFGAAGTSNINGVFMAELFNFPGLSVIQYHSSASLFKTAHPFNQLYQSAGIISPGDTAGHLKINTTTMVRDTGNPSFIYTDTTSTANYSSGVKWTLAGNVNFTAFSTSVTRGFPVAANANYLPSTFSKSQNLTLNLGTAGYTNTDSLMVMIYTSSSATSGAVFKYVAGNASSVTFTPADMSSLITNGSFNEILVYAKNFSNMSVNGKNYVFVMHYTIGAFITVTP
jgi:hypothetical protein